MNLMKPTTQALGLLSKNTVHPTKNYPIFIRSLTLFLIVNACKCCITIKICLFYSKQVCC